VNIKLERHGVKEVVIKSYPEFLFPEAFKLVHNALIRHDYSIQLTEVSAYIEVVNEDFENKLHKSQRRRLKKSREEGFHFQPMAPDQLSTVYEFIEARRSEKSYELSMAPKRMEILINTFPSRIKLFAVYHHETLIAASLTIMERSDVLYDFYHDHDSRYDSVSPVVFLLEGIYNCVRENNVSTINLGTSMVGNELNKPLLEFKQSLGADTSPKHTFKRLL
jgi:predicted N-acyltransferase